MRPTTSAMEALRFMRQEAGEAVSFADRGELTQAFAAVCRLQKHATKAREKLREQLKRNKKLTLQQYREENSQYDRKD